MSFSHSCHINAVTISAHSAEHLESLDYEENQVVQQPFIVLCSGLMWDELFLCPQPHRSYSFLSVQRRQQILLT